MPEGWDDDLITDRTDHNLEVCYCIGPQVVDGVRQFLCPCDMRAVNAFKKGHGVPYVDPVDNKE